MQDTEKRKVLNTREEEVKKEKFPWELSLLIGSLGIGIVLIALKMLGII